MSSTLAVIDKDGNEQILYEPDEALHQSEYHASDLPNLLALGTRGTGKAVALDTPIPTPQGYRTMQELAVGDFVFDEYGAQTRIVWKSEVHTDETGTYRLTFDDGTDIVCGGQHEWFTLTKKEATGRYPAGSLKTTTEIANTLNIDSSGEVDHRILQSLRYIVKAERIENCLVQCIQVAAESHMYLVSRASIPTHNSLQLRMDAHLRCLMVPNFRALIVRRTMPELRQSHLNDIEYEMAMLGGTYLSTVSTAKYPNGSTLKFDHCETEANIMNFLSRQYGFIGFDELSTFTLTQFLLISAAARAPMDAPYRAVIRAGSNTMGIGAGWMKTWFIDKNVRYEDYPDYNPADYGVITSWLKDNRHLDVKSYTARLQNLPEHVRRSWLNAEFILEGAYFEDFWPTHEGKPWHVIDELPLLKGKPLFEYSWLSIYRAIDWGYSPDPAVCLWIAVLPNNRAIVFKERSWKRTLAPEVAKQIKRESEGMHIIDSFVDPTMYIKTGVSPFSIAELFEQNGIPVTPSQNDRELFGYAIHQQLNTIIDLEPQVQIVKPLGLYGCPDLIRTIPTLQMDKTDPRKIAPGDDHWAVALAYFCMGKAMPARDPIVPVLPRWRMPKQKHRNLMTV